ncbi:MAG: hypothetical protein U5K32_11210 [Bacteroidales bacterium]|nr:hypothetical protein [Bacteroidales bacterium]
MDSSFKTKQNIADEFGISVPTLNRILDDNNYKVRRGLISPREQQMIYKILGKPPVKKEK